MDSILDLERQEVKAIKETLQAPGQLELFQASAPQIFEDCFNMLLSQGAKAENFNLLKSLSDPNNQQAEALNNVFNAILAVCTQIFRANLRGTEEFAPILEELGVPRNKAAEV